MTQQIPTLTRAISNHGYVTLKDLANAILDTDEENQRLADALTAVLKDYDEDMEAEGYDTKDKPSVIAARNLLEEREQRADREWLHD